MKAKKLLAIALVFIILVNMFAFLPNYVQAKSDLESRVTGLYLKDKEAYVSSTGVGRTCWYYFCNDRKFKQC